MPPVFYLGTHLPGWLWDPAADFPLFVSHRRLARCATLRPATRGWALDSGGFTELSAYGTWHTGPAEYVRATARYDREIGRLEWAAPQDWMCEPFMVDRTGMTVADHQRRTVASFLELRDLWPAESDTECPFMPVLQGWQLADYEACEDLYQAAGVRLEDYPVVGIGSVCRRQATSEIARIVGAFSPRLALHGFGVKTQGLALFGGLLASADSMAWSYDGRRSAPLPGHGHKNCANCLAWAARWRERVLAVLEAGTSGWQQDELFSPGEIAAGLAGAA